MLNNTLLPLVEMRASGRSFNAPYVTIYRGVTKPEDGSDAGYKRKWETTL
jgi:hypothetical protein